MKNIFYTLGVLFSLCIFVTSCEYLDIVPDERPTEADAFKDKKAAERYLYSCYAFIPKERNGNYLYQTGELVTDYDRTFLEGNYSAASIGDFHYWSRMYAGIRRCYTLLKNIDGVPRMEEELKVQYKAEAKFLIAYFHFCLLRAYGPIILVEDEIDVSAGEAVPSKRMPFDQCVEWISNKFDEAINEGLLVEQATSYYGRATAVAAKALKGRLLLYAASPLFNGNREFYENFVDPETSEPLMNLDYDVNKWKVAQTACQEAVDYAVANGYKAFWMDENQIPSGHYPKNDTLYSLRMTFQNRENMEVIWADPRGEDFYGAQNQSAPRDAVNSGNSWNGVGPSLAVVKNFYTKNGLPISEDPAYYPADKYYNIGLYEGRTTCNLNLDREPRFYAWIGFHNGWFEMQRTPNAEHNVFDGRLIIKLRKNDDQGIGNRNADFSLTGYMLKKWVTPGYDTQNGYENYSWPIIRLDELYLNLAEAAAEAGDLETAKSALNVVRKGAGIPSVEKSWEGIATLDQKKLIEIIRQERTIELFAEFQYGWDIRRWKVAEQVLGKQPQGLNIQGATDEDFFQEVTVERRWKFSQRNYLLPIDDRELNINQKIVQNPGY